MENTNQDKTGDVKCGSTLLRVMRKDVDERTRKETIRKLHEGVVIQKTSAFVRIFSNAPVDKGGDHTPEVAQLYPMSSPRCWCEVIGQTRSAFPIPALFQ